MAFVCVYMYVHCTSYQSCSSLPHFLSQSVMHLYSFICRAFSTKSIYSIQHFFKIVPMGYLLLSTKFSVSALSWIWNNDFRFPFFSFCHPFLSFYIICFSLCVSLHFASLLIRSLGKCFIVQSLNSFTMAFEINQLNVCCVWVPCSVPFF